MNGLKNSPMRTDVLGILVYIFYSVERALQPIISVRIGSMLKKAFKCANGLGKGEVLSSASL